MVRLVRHRPTKGAANRYADYLPSPRHISTLPVAPVQARNVTNPGLRFFQAINGHPRFWGADSFHVNGVLRDIDSQSRLTDIRRRLNLPPALKEVAQPYGYGEHPLAHRKWRENAIDQMRRRFGHAPGFARGAGGPLRECGRRRVSSGMGTTRVF